MVLAALTLLIAIGGIAACGSVRAGRPPGQNAGAPAKPGACPSRAPGSGGVAGAASTTGPGTTRAGQPLIRTGAVIAVICQYALNPSPKTAGMQTRITLTRAAASGLAAILDAGTPVSGRQRCDANPFSQLVMFGYPGGTVVTASIQSEGCPAGPGVVTVGTRSAILGQNADDDLAGYTAIGILGHGGPVTPDLIGLSAASAARLAQQHGFTPRADGAVTDGAVPPGTVIFQSLPPGAAGSGPGTAVGMILAVSPAPDCTQRELAANYRGGGAGAGTVFGGIVFRDISGTSCTLTGTVSLTGLGATGTSDTPTIAARFAGPGVLSPDIPRVPAGSGPSPGELAYLWPLAAEYRDGATPGGLCAQQVRPAAWRITLASGAAFTVPNVDHGNVESRDPSGGLITCRGNVASEAAPSYWTS